MLSFARTYSITYLLGKNTLWRNSYYVRGRPLQSGVLIPCFTFDPPIKTLSQSYNSEVMSKNLHLFCIYINTYTEK